MVMVIAALTLIGCIVCVDPVMSTCHVVFTRAVKNVPLHQGQMRHPEVNDLFEVTELLKQQDQIPCVWLLSRVWNPSPHHWCCNCHLPLPTAPSPIGHLHHALFPQQTPHQSTFSGAGWPSLSHLARIRLRWSWNETHGQLEECICFCQIMAKFVKAFKELAQISLVLGIKYDYFFFYKYP